MPSPPPAKDRWTGVVLRLAVGVEVRLVLTPNRAMAAAAEFVVGAAAAALAGVTLEEDVDGLGAGGRIGAVVVLAAAEAIIPLMAVFLFVLTTNGGADAPPEKLLEVPKLLDKKLLVVAAEFRLATDCDDVGPASKPANGSSGSYRGCGRTVVDGGPLAKPGPRCCWDSWGGTMDILCGWGGAKAAPAAGGLTYVGGNHPSLP